MKILIIEDEKPAQDRLQKQLLAIDPAIEIVGFLDSIKNSVSWLKQNEHPDLLLLDIQLADGLSFSIFEQVNTNTPIIFCTAYDEHAIKAFKLNSVDYLLKPIDQGELAGALDKYNAYHKQAQQTINMDALQQLLNEPKKRFKQRFMVKVGDKIKSIDHQQIQFFYSEQKATFLQTADKRKYIIDYTLDQLDEMIDPSIFFRLNRKYITSLEAIENVFSYSNSRLKVMLNDCTDNDILVSRERVGKLKEWLDE